MIKINNCSSYLMYIEVDKCSNTLQLFFTNVLHILLTSPNQLLSYWTWTTIRFPVSLLLNGILWNWFYLQLLLHRFLLPIGRCFLSWGLLVQPHPSYFSFHFYFVSLEINNITVSKGVVLTGKTFREFKLIFSNEGVLCHVRIILLLCIGNRSLIWYIIVDLRQSLELFQLRKLVWISSH